MHKRKTNYYRAVLHFKYSIIIMTLFPTNRKGVNPKFYKHRKPFVWYKASSIDSFASSCWMLKLRRINLRGFNFFRVYCICGRIFRLISWNVRLSIWRWTVRWRIVWRKIFLENGSVNQDLLSKKGEPDW